jgi:hypothetical protein
MLARPEHFIVMEVQKMRAIRAEQGLTGVIVPLDEEHLRARLDTIYPGELQAMEVAGRTLFDFPDASVLLETQPQHRPKRCSQISSDEVS